MLLASAPQPKIACMSETTLYDSHDHAAAYIARDGETIYTWQGSAVAYLITDKVYSWSGKHLGWFVDGIVCDASGHRVGYVPQHAPS